MSAHWRKTDTGAKSAAEQALGVSVSPCVTESPEFPPPRVDGDGDPMSARDIADRVVRRALDREPEWRCAVKMFLKNAPQPMEPWAPGYDMTGVSVSEPDAAAGSPKAGDWIATNAKDETDRWLIAAQYHADNYVAVES